MEGKRASGEFDTKDGNETYQVVQTDSGEILLVTCEAGQEREAAGLAYDDEVEDFSVVLIFTMMIMMVMMMIMVMIMMMSIKNHHHHNLPRSTRPALRSATDPEPQSSMDNQM